MRASVRPMLINYPPHADKLSGIAALAGAPAGWGLVLPGVDTAGALAPQNPAESRTGAARSARLTQHRSIRRRRLPRVGQVVLAGVMRPFHRPNARPLEQLS